MTRPLLTHCPECDYNLCGLPPVHRCPECGEEFAKDTFVMQGRRTRGFIGFLVRTLLTIWVAVGAVNCALAHNTVGVIVNAGGVGLMAAWWAGWFWRQRPYYLLVTNKDVIFRAGNRERLRVPLRKISHAEYRTLTCEIVLVDADSEPVGIIPDLGRGDYALLAQACEEINQRIEDAQ